MGELSQRIIAKVSGPAWEPLRGQFMQIARLLLAVSPDADSELMTTYVKFTIHTAPQSPVFAAVWLKSSKRLIVGLALPEEYEAEELGPALPGTMYKGLTKYFVVERGGAVPKGFANWAKLAYRRTLSAEPWATIAGFLDELAAREKGKQRQARKLLDEQAESCALCGPRMQTRRPTDGTWRPAMSLPILAMGINKVVQPWPGGPRAIIPQPAPHGRHLPQPALGTRHHSAMNNTAGEQHQ